MPRNEMWNSKTPITLIMKYEYENHLCIHSNKLESLLIGFLNLTSLFWRIFTWIEDDIFLKQIIFQEIDGREGTIYFRIQNIRKNGVPLTPPPPQKKILFLFGVGVCRFICVITDPVSLSISVICSKWQLIS